MLSDADKLAAEVAIGALIQRYAHAVDLHQTDVYVNCFTPNGAFVLSSGASFTGRDAIRARAGSADGPTRRHFFMPPVLEFTSATTAKGTGFLLLMENYADEGVKGPFPVDYFDEYERTDEGWLLASRRVGRVF